MLEKILTVENFQPIAHGSYPTNIPNLWTIAYQYTCPNSQVVEIDTRPVFMKITAYHKATNVDTTSDFDIVLPCRCAVVRNPKSGLIEYDWMAIARGRTSGKLTRAVAYDESSDTITFDAITGGATEVVDVFFLPAAGQIRLTVESPEGAKNVSLGIFESSLDSLNSMSQYSVNQLMRFNSRYTLTAAWKLNIEVKTPAQIILNSKDVSEISSLANFNELGILEIPVLFQKEV